jgi:hypothetical protein
LVLAVPTLLPSVFAVFEGHFVTADRKTQAEACGYTLRVLRFASLESLGQVSAIR